ncbi:NAC domain [Sesbania bispinosa]|nr:NAC domain [Sesbania bispinosa]
MALRTIAPGFRFHPTDEELVGFYLKRKVTGRPFHIDPIAVIEIYKFEPWDLPCRSKLKTRDLEWYFFTALDKKYGNGSRTNRATERGYWKTTGKDRTIKNGERTVGMKKTLVYHIGRAPHGDRTNWVMHEYRMVDEQLAQAGVLQDAYVLCRIFEKSGQGPKNGEKYGAPFIEEEWDDDAVVDAVPVPVQSVPAVDDEDLKEVSTIGAYIENKDLDKNLDDANVTIGTAGFSSNFHYGECSGHPQHSDQKPLVDTFGIYGPQNDQPFNMAEQYDMDTNAVKDGDTVELNHDGNSLNLSYPFDDLDVYFDATGYPLSFDDGSFLETNDLVNLGEGNPTEADPSGTDMLDEYLACSDDDILKYISFDSPQNTESQSPVIDQGPASVEKSVEGDITLASKHVSDEAQSSNEASSKHNPQASKMVSGETNPFVKQANKLLASIPAPPAFASEFPSKEFALGLHPAAQSSNSAHVTAGMISITDITLRGDAMDWMVGKNGGFNNPLMSTRFSQPGVNSAALMPICGLVSSKTAFVLSHGWIFLMSFSVLILSLSFKIGCIMYSGK